MYGATLRKVQRPDDDQFYCVVLYGDRAVGKMAPGSRGTFDEMVTDAGRILASDPGATQVHVNHKGNFWHRVER